MPTVGTKPAMVPPVQGGPSAERQRAIETLARVAWRIDNSYTREVLMICAKCRIQVPEDSRFCPSCGSSCGPASAQTATPSSQTPPGQGTTFHRIPKCTYCGNMAEWKVGPVLRWWDWLIGVLLLFPFFLPGVGYIVTIAVIRGSKERREKICTRCRAKNLFTFQY